MSGSICSLLAFAAVDLKLLKNLAIGITGVMSSVVAFILAFAPKDAAAVSLADACALDAAQQEKVREYAQLLAANASCAVNISFPV